MSHPPLHPTHRWALSLKDTASQVPCCVLPLRKTTGLDPLRADQVIPGTNIKAGVLKTHLHQREGSPATLAIDSAEVQGVAKEAASRSGTSSFVGPGNTRDDRGNENGHQWNREERGNQHGRA